jgi:hypothetical protein
MQTNAKLGLYFLDARGRSLFWPKDLKALKDAVIECGSALNVKFCQTYRKNRQQSTRHIWDISPETSEA